MVTAGWGDGTLLLPGPWGQRRLTRHLCQGRPQWLLTAWLIATQWRARAPAATRDRLQQRQAQCELRSLLRYDRRRTRGDGITKQAKYGKERPRGSVTDTVVGR